MKKILPYIVPGFFLFMMVILIASGLRPQTVDDAFDYDRFARLPVLEGGRFKPLDSLARTNLLILRGKQSVINEDGEKEPARQWLTKLILDPQQAETYPVFRIDHGDLKTMLGVDAENRKYFSYRELQPHLHTVETQARLVNEDADKRDAFQKAIVALQNHLFLYQMLMTSVRPLVPDGSVTERYHEYIETLKTGARKQMSSGTIDVNAPEVQKLQQILREFSQVSSERSLRFIPLPASDGTWLNLKEGLLASLQTGSIPEIVQLYGLLSDAYSAGEYDKANELVRTLEKAYAIYGTSYKDHKIQYEYAFNQLQPFMLCIELYILLLLTTVTGWVLLSKRTLNAALWILTVTVIIHTVGMLVRMWLMGRPPVTNLYSSAVYVGWGTAGLALLLEWVFRNGVGSMIAAVTGLLSLIIAQHLMAMGDTMEMMRAVLDSNFWLTTHVLTVTMGYAATFVAGFIAIAYVLLGIFTNRLNQEVAESIRRMVYGIVCFALFFSFVGTFLGGIWADQSWGRFWGWDPKENGALMIVIWNALILHAYRAGAVKTKGVMLLAVTGNMITAWSWFGTNMLGKGLHSYGFMESAMLWLLAFWMSQIIIILLGLYVPDRLWRSHPRIQ